MKYILTDIYGVEEITDCDVPSSGGDVTSAPDLPGLPDTPVPPPTAPSTPSVTPPTAPSESGSNTMFSFAFAVLAVGGLMYPW